MLDQFKMQIEQVESKYDDLDVTAADIKGGILEAGESIKKLMSISCAGASELKNQHNELFLSLIERIRYLN